MLLPGEKSRGDRAEKGSDLLSSSFGKGRSRFDIENVGNSLTDRAAKQGSCLPRAGAQPPSHAGTIFSLTLYTNVCTLSQRDALSPRRATRRLFLGKSIISRAAEVAVYGRSRRGILPRPLGKERLLCFGHATAGCRFYSRTRRVPSSGRGFAPIKSWEVLDAAPKPSPQTDVAQRVPSWSPTLTLATDERCGAKPKAGHRNRPRTRNATKHLGGPASGRTNHAR